MKNRRSDEGRREKRKGRQIPQNAERQHRRKDHPERLYRHPAGDAVLSVPHKTVSDREKIGGQKRKKQRERRIVPQRLIKLEVQKGPERSGCAAAGAVQSCQLMYQTGKADPRAVRGIPYPKKPGARQYAEYGGKSGPRPDLSEIRAPEPERFHFQ